MHALVGRPWWAESLRRGAAGKGAVIVEPLCSVRERGIGGQPSGVPLGEGRRDRVSYSSRRAFPAGAPLVSVLCGAGLAGSAAAGGWQPVREWGCVPEELRVPEILAGLCILVSLREVAIEGVQSDKDRTGSK